MGRKLTALEIVADMTVINAYSNLQAFFEAPVACTFSSSTDCSAAKLTVVGTVVSSRCTVTRTRGRYWDPPRRQPCNGLAGRPLLHYVPIALYTDRETARKAKSKLYERISPTFRSKHFSSSMHAYAAIPSMQLLTTSHRRAYAAKIAEISMTAVALAFELLMISRLQ